jgi:phosphatidate cytidylyltransferase
VLKTRILTALIIFPATVAVVFLTPPWLFRLLIAILLMAGCWEFRRLVNLAPAAGWGLVLLQAGIFGVMMAFWPLVRDQALGILTFACLCWLLMFFSLSGYREGGAAGGAYRVRGALSALAVISFSWFALSWLQDQPRGPFIVFLPLLIIWASDVGAYFSGRQFGRRKLAPVISPKKTWEGVYGGIALALAAAFLWSGPIAALGIPAGALVVITVVTGLSSVGGDLFISMHKRTVGIKDTGTLFPGHGGVLDRYDSLLAGAPFFALAFRIVAT